MTERLMTIPDSFKTTVIVPTHNRSSLLSECLDALFAQTLPAAEIIVADDGSSDGTAAVLERLPPEVVRFSKPNTGKADTLNRALAMARHPLVWIMDDDDLATPQALAMLTQGFMDNPGAGFVYGRHERLAVEPDGSRVLLPTGYWREVDSEDFFRVQLEDFFVHQPGLLVRRSAYDAAGPFSTRYPRLEDFEMMVRLARVAEGVQVPGTIFYQRQHDGDRVGGLAAADRQRRWMAEQMEFLAHLRDTLPLACYLGRSRWGREGLEPGERREALIYRGVVMARGKLWPEAIADFSAAATLQGAAGALNATEVGVLRRCFFSKYGSDEVQARPEIVRGLRQIGRLGPVGRAMARTLARSLVWFVRRAIEQRAWSEARRHAGAALSLLTGSVGVGSTASLRAGATAGDAGLRDTKEESAAPPNR